VWAILKDLLFDIRDEIDSVEILGLGAVFSTSQSKKCYYACLKNYAI
jgi:hypothetical protein